MNVVSTSCQTDIDVVSAEERGMDFSFRTAYEEAVRKSDALTRSQMIDSVEEMLSVDGLRRKRSAGMQLLRLPI